MKVNATLTEISAETLSPVVEMTFQIKKEDLAGLNYTRPEFLLDIIPVEDLYK